MPMLMRTDPFRELDRLTQQVFGSNENRGLPAAMPMDAWREGDKFLVRFDLPGVDADNIDIDVERNVLTVTAKRDDPGEHDYLASERPRGTFSRQLILGDMVDLEHVHATYERGVLELTIPVAEQAKPRKISVGSGDSDRQVEAKADQKVIDA